MVGIYKIQSPSGKVYIGQTWDTNKRIWYYKRGYCKSQPVLYRSIKKYGFDAHVISIVHELPSDIPQEVLDNYEQLYMDAHRGCGLQLLNMREAGSAGKFSLESRRKMSEAKKKAIVSDKTLERLRFLAKNKSEETKQRHSIYMMGNKRRLGIPHTKETLEIISRSSVVNYYKIWAPDRVIYETDNLAAFCSEKGLNVTGLQATYKGISQKTCKGYCVIEKRPLKEVFAQSLYK